MTFELETGGAVDLSQTVTNGMTIYLGDPVPSVRRVKQIRTDGVNVSEVLLGSHTGTHVDAPLHFIEGGKSVDTLSPELCVGEAVVIDLGDKPQGSEISPEDLGRGSLVDKDGLIVLLYTGMSKLWKNLAARTNFTYLSPEAADWLVLKKAKTVGIDYLSVEKFGSRDAPVHRKLLSNGIPIIESLNEKLGIFAGKRIFLVCLPLKVGGSDGGPARALAYPLRAR
ncbi:MAG: cyclase family protein [Nitrososphaerota archaeon]|nr:cyclase family protein [Nitrososphaerota archaeon]